MSGILMFLGGLPFPLQETKRKYPRKFWDDLEHFSCQSSWGSFEKSSEFLPCDFSGLVLVQVLVWWASCRTASICRAAAGQAPWVGEVELSRLGWLLSHSLLLQKAYLRIRIRIPQAWYRAQKPLKPENSQTQQKTKRNAESGPGPPLPQKKN